MGPEVTPDRGLTVPLSPREVDVFGVATDPDDWQHWWELNKDRFLARERFGTASIRTSDDDFYLGSGQQRQGDDGAVGRAAAARALAHVMEHGGPRARMQAALLAAPGTRDADLQRRLRHVVEFLLVEGDEHIAATGTFALGAAGDARHLALLTSLARDDEAGRASCQRAEVDPRVRAFAATGLGLAAGATHDMQARRAAVGVLARLVDDSATPRAVKSAAIVGLGLAPLPLETSAEVCYCGDCARENPSASFQAQLSYLIEHVIVARDYDPLLRAEAVTALGRLVGARLDSVPADIKRGVVSTLHRVLDERSRQTLVVRECAVLALGLVGDADESHEDNWVRWSLRRAARSGKAGERRFALVSLALVGARKGQSAAPWAATDEVRGELSQHLAQGLGGVRPWAALALGVLGHDLRRAGVTPDVTVDTALDALLRRARRSERGAIALALGLRGAAQHAKSLLDVLEHERDEVAQSYAALALGLAGARESQGALDAVLAADGTHPLVRLRSGIALGLLGSQDIVPRLLEDLARPLSDARLHATVATLGAMGDPRGGEPLAALVIDTTRTRPERAREEALGALGKLLEPRTCVWRTVLAHGANYRAGEHERSASDAKTKGIGSVVVELR